MKIEIELDEEKIKKAALKAGKLDVRDVEWQARSAVSKKIQRKINEALKTTDLDRLIADAIDDIDWNKLIKNRIADIQTYGEL